MNIPGGAMRGIFRSMRRRRRALPGTYQPYSHTLPDRYPWLFKFAADELKARPSPRLLSFGCSRGDEVFSLRQYFPGASIKGIDIDPRNIKACESRARSAGSERFSFACAATTHDEPSGLYDAIFCLAVLVIGDLTTSAAQSSAPKFYFSDFERMIGDFERCLKPGGLLLLHTTNFRFSDTASAPHFDVVLNAEPSQLAPDVLFDRNNQLMAGCDYYPVGFRKRDIAGEEGHVESDPF